MKGLEYELIESESHEPHLFVIRKQARHGWLLRLARSSHPSCCYSSLLRAHYDCLRFERTECTPPLRDQERVPPAYLRTLAVYYVLDGTCYQAPSLHGVLSARLVSE